MQFALQTQKPKTATERLDDLYKWLLAPTTFLILTLWSELTYIVTYQEKLNVTSALPRSLTASDLLKLPVVRLSLDVTPFVLSVFIFLMFANSVRGRVWIGSRFFSFWGLTYTFASVGYSLIYFLPPFPSDLLRGITLGSFTGVVSICLVLDAHSRETGTTLWAEMTRFVSP